MEYSRKRADAVLLYSSSMPIIFAPFILGAALLVSPLILDRANRNKIYTQEFLNRFTTRVMGRALGVILMMLCLAAGASLSRHSYPGLTARFVAAFCALFGFVWVSGLVFGILSKVSRKFREWEDSRSTDKIAPRQNQLEVAIGVVVFLSFACWAALPLVTR